MYWYVEAFRRYADFRGRSHRTEYWMFILFHNIVIVGLFFLFYLFLLPGGSAKTLAIVPWILMIIYALVSFIPTLALTARRLQDSGHSGWFILLAAIPFGAFVILFFTLLDSEPGENRWGPNPKEDYIYNSDIDEIGAKDEY